MSDPNLDPDDPRLTAYALGELDDPAEREAVERLLAASPAGRTEVEQIRQFAHALTAEFDGEREEYALGQPSENRPANLISFPAAGRRRQARWSRAMLQVAATLMVLAGLAAWEIRRTPHYPPAATVAMQDSPSGRSVPSAVARPDALRSMDNVAPTPMPQAETAATEPLIALEKPAGKEDFDKSTDVLADRGDVPLPAAPAAAPAASSPRLALNAPMRRASEAPKPAVVSATAAGTLAKQESGASPRPLDSPPVASGKALDERLAKSSSAPADVSAGNDSDDDHRLTASLVRVQWPNGMTTAGVVIASDGLVLTQKFAATTDHSGSPEVTFGDGSTFKLSSSHPVSGSGLRLLKINASGLAAVSLASVGSSEARPFILAAINRATGATKISRADSALPLSSASADHAMAPATRSKSENEPVDFVFDTRHALVGIGPASADPKKTRRVEAFHFLSAGELETLSRMISAAQP